MVGVRDFDWPKDEPLTHGYGSRGWRFAGKGRACPSPEAGEAGRGQMHLRYLIKPICVQYGRLFSQKNAFRIQRSRAPERGLSRGNPSPLTLFWFLLQGQKKRHGGEPC